MQKKGLSFLSFLSFCLFVFFSLLPMQGIPKVAYIELRLIVKFFKEVMESLIPSKMEIAQLKKTAAR